MSKFLSILAFFSLVLFASMGANAQISPSQWDDGGDTLYFVFPAATSATSTIEIDMKGYEAASFQVVSPTAAKISGTFTGGATVTVKASVFETAASTNTVEATVAFIADSSGSAVTSTTTYGLFHTLPGAAYDHIKFTIASQATEDVKVIVRRRK